MERKARPESLRYFLEVLRSDRKTSGTATAGALIYKLISQHNYTEAEATEEVHNALQDGLLKTEIWVQSKKRGVIASPTNMSNNCLLRLAKFKEIPKSSHDTYCFECHAAGTLKPCRQCSHSFHEFCFRRNTNKPLYQIPSVYGQRKPPAVYNSGSDSEYNDDDHQSECQPEKQTTNDERDLCTCCRILKRASQKPAQIQRDELCHLLAFILERNRTWLVYDISGYFHQMKLPRQVTAVALSLLHISPKVHLEDIAEKLKNQCYKLDAEFLVDILKLQHSIGVFFGIHSSEFEATKYLVRDIRNDLSELKCCPGCFRHSNERDCPFWFAKPCGKRHQIVYAKYGEFPYWPAKVLRKLPHCKFDVRFFGNTHSRASVHKRNIKPIDTDHKALNLGNKRDIKRAIQELQYHQILAKYSPEIFSFHADKTIAAKAMQEAVTKVRASSMVNAPNRRNAIRNLAARAVNNVKLNASDPQTKVALKSTEQKKTGTTKRTRSSANSTRNASDIPRAQFKKEKKLIEKRVKSCRVTERGDGEVIKRKQ